MDTAPETIKKSPTQSVAITVAIVTLLATLGTLREGVSLLNRSKNIISYRHIQSSFQNGTFDQSTKDLQNLFQPLRTSSLLLLRNVSPQPKPEIQKILLEVDGVLQSLAKNEYKQALLSFNQLRDYRLHDLIANMEANRTNTLHLLKIEDDFKLYQKTHDEYEASLAEAPTQIRIAKEKIKDQKTLAGDAILRTAKLFNLEPLHSLESGEVEFYQDGILESLPKLKGLPDDIEDAKALKSELERIGGSVSLTGSNVQARFEQELMELKSESRVYNESIKNYEEILAEKEATNEQLKMEMYKKARDLEHDISALVLEAVRPESTLLLDWVFRVL